MPVATIIGLLLFASGLIYLTVNWEDDHKWILPLVFFIVGGLAVYSDHTGGERKTLIGSTLIILGTVLATMAAQEIEALIRQHGYRQTFANLVFGLMALRLAFALAERYTSPNTVENTTDLVVFGYLATGCLAAKLVWRQSRQPQEVPQTGAIPQ